jgi:hypothetical protein
MTNENFSFDDYNMKDRIFTERFGFEEHTPQIESMLDLTRKMGKRVRIRYVTPPTNTDYLRGSITSSTSTSTDPPIINIKFKEKEEQSDPSKVHTFNIEDLDVMEERK